MIVRKQLREHVDSRQVCCIAMHCIMYILPQADLDDVVYCSIVTVAPVVWAGMATVTHRNLHCWRQTLVC